MNRLIKTVENLGINYKINTYGENYFFSAPPVIYEGICLFFTWQELQKENDVKKYLNRRKNLVIFSEGHNVGGCWLVVASAEDRAKHLNYRAFMDPAVKECEQTAHKLYESGHPEKVNAALFKIMNKYEKLYIKSLLNVVTKTA